jgi:hypothetical protein
VAVPISAVREIIEYEVSLPPAHAHRLVSGVGVYGERVLVSLTLMPLPRQGGAKLRRTKGVLLRVGGQEEAEAGVGGSPENRREVLWALEVSELMGMIDCEILPKRVDQVPESLPPWVYRATAGADAHLTAWIDLGGMMAELGSNISGNSQWSSRQF